ATGVGSDGVLTGLDLSGTSHTQAGTYTDTWTFTDVTGNYNDASGTVTDQIDKADAVVTVNGYTGTYDGNRHGATASVTGVDAGGTAVGSSLDLGGVFRNVPGGTVHWVFTGGANYNDQSGDVSIIITARTLTVTATVDGKTYDGMTAAVGHLS